MINLRGGPEAALERRRLLSRAALLWESVWPRLWPALGLLGLFLVLALLELPQALPGGWHTLLLAAVAGGIGFLLWRGFRGFRPPGDAAAERRLERQSGLRHRPLQALADRPAAASDDDPAAQALWKAHQERAAAQIAKLRVGAPRPGLPARDPVALRAALGLGLVSAVVVAWGDAPERLRRALLPEFSRPAPAPAQRLEAWVTPPAYTGAAPVFLDPAGGAATVPQGSRLQVAVSGGSGAPPLLTTDAGDATFRALDGASFLAETPLETGGKLAVRREGRTLAAWTLSVQADAPPTAAFSEPPARAQRGLGTRLPWRAEDDWGLASLRAEARLKARPDAPPLVLELSLPGGNQNKHARGTAQPDLSAHPWAGLDVEFRLVVRDGAGQEGRSDAAALALPERSFNHRVAQRVIAVRKALSLDPGARRPARAELESIAAAPELFEHDVATYLALRAARTRLMVDRRPEAISEVQDLLWEVALALEEGRDGRTLRALQQAREALRRSLEEAERLDREQREADQQRREAEEREEAERRDGQQRQEDGKTQEQRDAERQQREQAERERREAQDEQRAELQKRIQELRDAIRQHLEALAEKLQRENAEAMPFDPQNRLMDQRELNRRTERMQDAAREGRTEDAKRELAELEEMLRALEEGRVARQENQERQGQRQRGQQQMGVVQDMVRRQGEMLDRSHQRADADEGRRAQERRQRQLRDQGLRWPPEPQQPQRGQGESTDPQAREQSAQDARRQRALRRALGELMQQFGDLTGEVPEALGRADQAMRDAQEALREGGDARDPQARAMRALQEGGRQMAQSMQRQFGAAPEDGQDGGDGDDMAGDPQNGGEGQDRAQAQGEGRDPLGRRRTETGGSNEEGADTRVPDEAELLRTRRIQEELRRRGAEKARPVEELDYIDRLLRRF
ncbi:hypothetical protein GCM10009416_30670 [Craurococcus roseus]|uniref:TIGR02302 family protein n=1 Tax=Craurococcus roseus TaxID=77585 RepID=A0ABN1FFZ3_9PROT